MRRAFAPLISGFCLAATLILGRVAGASPEHADLTQTTSEQAPLEPERARLEVGRFSTAGGQLPEGWKPLEFKKIARHTQYSLEREDDHFVVKAKSDAAASGLIRTMEIDLAQYPIVRWRWRVANILEKGDVTKKSGDDYPARLYIAFKYEPERVGFFRKAQYLAARTILGDLPIGAINYIWASHAPKGETVDNPFAGSFVKMTVVESGAEHVGEWRTEERNVYQDYVDAFGGEPPPVEGVAIMTDTDNTGESATAWYGDIVFLGKER